MTGRQKQFDFSTAEKFVMLYNSGMLLKHIAKKFNVSTSTVSNYIYDLQPKAKINIQLKNKAELTQTKLREMLNYNPSTGVFTWLKMPPYAKSKLVGKEAGCKTLEKNGKFGRVVIIICQQRFYAHQLAWLYMTGSLPKLEIDHIDGDPSNNKFENLRDVTHKVNQNNPVAKQRESEAAKQRCKNPKERERLSLINKGRQQSEEIRQKKREAAAKYWSTRTEEERKLFGKAVSKSKTILRNY